MRRSLGLDTDSTSNVDMEGMAAMDTADTLPMEWRGVANLAMVRIDRDMAIIRKDTVETMGTIISGEKDRAIGRRSSL